MNAKELTKYVTKVLQADINIPLSWGTHNVAPIIPTDEQHPDGAGLQFCVNGFNFAGIVRIVYNEGSDVFNVSFWKDGKKADENGDVYVDELVPYIDNYVELCDDYEEKIKGLTESDPLYKLLKNVHCVAFEKDDPDDNDPQINMITL